MLGRTRQQSLARRHDQYQGSQSRAGVASRMAGVAVYGRDGGEGGLEEFRFGNLTGFFHSAIVIRRLSWCGILKKNYAR